jgi:Leucine-rich repeat (LRR) protein
MPRFFPLVYLLILIALLKVSVIAQIKENQADHKVWIYSFHYKVYRNFNYLGYSPIVIDAKEGELITLQECIIPVIAFRNSFKMHSLSHVHYLYSREDVFCLEKVKHIFKVNGFPYGSYFAKDSYLNDEEIPYTNLSFLEVPQTVSLAILDKLASLTSSLPILKIRGFNICKGNDVWEGLQNWEALRVLDINNNSTFKNKHLQELSKLKKLSVLDISYTSISEEGIKYLQAFPHLHTLHIGPIAEEEVLHLKGIQNLHALKLSEAELRNNGLQCLQHLKNLQILNLTGVNRLGDGKLGFSYLEQLEELYLNFTSLQDVDWEDIGTLKNLNTLQILEVEPVHLEKLKFLKNLRTLLLYHPNGLLLKNLKDFKQLENIELGHIKNNMDISCLGELPCLSYLALTAIDIDQAGLAFLNNFPKLEILKISECKIANNNLQPLSNLIKLHTLMFDCTRLNDSSLIYLKDLPSLSYLDISYTNISDRGLAYLHDIPTLHTLVLGGETIKDTAMGYLKSMQQLQYLVLINTFNRDEDIETLRKSLPNCRIIIKQRPW